jgi:ABC-type Na+ efflux pump permease subunit
MWMGNGGSWVNETLNPVNVVAAVLFNSALKMWIGIEAGYRLAQERKMGTFELLLSTALTEQDILKGQWLALRRQFLRPTVAVMVVECLFLAASLRQPQSDTHFPALAAWLACLTLLVADMIAVSWVAMACALVAKTPNLAAVQAIARVLIMPSVVFAVVSGSAIPLTALAGHPEPGWRFYVGWWFGLGIAADLGYGFAAWHRLHTRFRQLASQRFLSGRGPRSAGLPQHG